MGRWISPRRLWRGGRLWIRKIQLPIPQARKRQLEFLDSPWGCQGGKAQPFEVRNWRARGRVCFLAARGANVVDRVPALRTRRTLATETKMAHSSEGILQYFICVV